MSQEKVHTEGNVDRISQLPHDLIGNILSRLPTIEAVKTCVLSKDWEHKWTCVSKIQIDCNGRWASQERLPHFVNFMQKMSRYGHNVTNIYIKSAFPMFSIGDPGLFRSVISGFLAYKAEILEIDFFFCPKPDIVIQSRFLSAETLRELALGYLFLNISNEIYFPHLEKLSFKSVEISGDTTLKFTLPVLQTLLIDRCTWPDVKLVEMYVPSLHTLVSVQTNSTEIGDYEIKIIGATGPVLFDSDGVLDNILFVGSNIVSASIMTWYEYTDEYSPSERLLGNLTNLLRESLPTLVDLKLSPCIAQLFVKVLLESNHGCSLPIFNKLVRLFLCFAPDDAFGGTETLLKLLHAAPFLKYLAINTQHCDGLWDDYGFDYDAVDSIPSCLSSVEEMKVELHMFELYNNDNEDNHTLAQIRLGKFLMQIGEKAQLKRFACEISVDDSDFCDTDEFMEQISSFPKAPPHFSLCATEFRTGKRIMSFCYCESSGWVVDE